MTLANTQAEEVLRALDLVLASRSFRSSRQCSSMLAYIVRHTLSGEEHLLRERVIGAEVFGRPADYETGDDPVVRLRASEVRKRLAQYYLSDVDAATLQIEIPSGSYRATFHQRATEARLSLSVDETDAKPVQGSEPMEPIDASPPLGVPSSSPRARRLPVLIAAVCVACAALAVLLSSFPLSASQRSFRAFWGPWLQSAKPVIISVGSNAVYRMQYDYADRYARAHGLQGVGQEFYIPFSADNPMPAGQLFAAHDSFVALGDVSSVSDFVALLAREKRPFQERFPNDVSFAELRDTPSILVGGFNNPVTLEMTKHLPFTMRSGSEILDTRTPGREWNLRTSIDSRDTADYAVITRMVQQEDDAPFVSVAGLGQYGTLAAADLLSTPATLHAITDGLPKGWSHRNLQVVIRLRVVDFKPASPQVVAFASW